MAAESTSVPKCAIVLRTADQYDMWKARVGDVCWSATGKDIFAVTDEQCKAVLAVFEDPAAEKKAGTEWLAKCWNLVSNSLHDDVYRKVTHVSRGLLQTLLLEISHALVVNNLEEVPALRLELYGASMQKQGECDLQAWVSFIVERAAKLNFLKKPVDENELIAIFLQGLHPTFNQLQVAFAVPGGAPKSFAAAVTTVRKFAANPTVAAELAKLKSRGVSQSMFPLITSNSQSQVPQAQNYNSQVPQAQVPQAQQTQSQVPQAQPQVPQVQPPYPQACRLFASTGQCRYGSRCKFVHTATPAAQSAMQPQSRSNSVCNFCELTGHAEEICPFKQKLLARLRSETESQTALSTTADIKPPLSAVEEYKWSDAATPFHFVMTTEPDPSFVPECLWYSDTISQDDAVPQPVMPDFTFDADAAGPRMSSETASSSEESCVRGVVLAASHYDCAILPPATDLAPKTDSLNFDFQPSPIAPLDSPRENTSSCVFPTS
jgi:hypothetical protein